MCAQIQNRPDMIEIMSPDINHHFSKIANRYSYLRTTDPEPIISIVEELNELSYIKAADIGCGPGGYDMILFEYIGDKLHLSCVDSNNDMLRVLDTNLKKQGISSFLPIYSGAEKLPFTSNTLDCVFSFNAIQHFNLLSFLQESGRVLKNGGYSFIYTRLREQNRRNIWGQCFPEFCRKETRLYTLTTIMKAVMSVPVLRTESIKFFKYKRVFTLEQLVKRARAHHYSTFHLYSPEELEEAIAGFVQNIKRQFNDAHRVSWFDEMTLFVIRKEG